MSDLLNDKFYISFNCIDLILKTSLNFIFTVKSFSVKLHSWKPQRPSWHKPLPPMEGGQPCKRKNLSNHIFCSLEHSTITPLSPHFPCDGQNLERERMRIQFVASTFTQKPSSPLFLSSPFTISTHLTFFHWWCSKAW